MTNIFQNITINKKEEEFIDLLKDKNIRIERIVSNGQVSKEDFWYDQEENEYIIVLEGSAIVEFKDKQVSLSKGDTLLIQKNEKHRVKYTDIEEPTIWLAIFYI